MDIQNLIIGILILLVAILYLLYTIREVQKENDLSIQSYNINILVGIIVFIMIGLSLVYNELKMYL